MPPSAKRKRVALMRRERLLARTICGQAMQIRTLKTGLLPAVAIELAIRSLSRKSRRDRREKAPASCAQETYRVEVQQLAAFAHDLSHVFGLLMLGR
ncbi:hypothetical protein [Bradyrhizobium sp. LMG 9283]|uniref:hypothetical protein n=1 Tax=Bradyrhizobium sp. LMG 9283 TaxID=592064 RepID=UPI00388F403A